MKSAGNERGSFYRLFTGGDPSVWDLGLESVGGEMMGAPPAGVPSDAEEQAAFEPNMARLRESYARNPAETLRDVEEAFELGPAERERFRRDFERMLERSKHLEQTEQEARAAEALEAVTLPSSFMERIVERYRDQTIRIDPNDFRFEDDSFFGILGWGLFNGLPALVVPRTGGIQDFRKLADGKGRPFRSHESFRSGFRYQMGPSEPGKPLSIALFSDFGTGLAHSRYIAKQIEVDAPDCAVHLGDVYYTGTTKQYFEYFERPLARVVSSERTKLFLLADNHEGYSAFEGYTYYLDKKRRLHPETQEQEGSYFSVRGASVQLLGVDTIWNGRKGRIEDRGVLAWLEDRLAEGRRDGLANLLLTGHHPYEQGKPQAEDLFTDVAHLVKDDLLDLWFWGNTHYCTLFDRNDTYRFYGSCIGHGGYPYGRKPRGTENPAEPLFFEDSSRYSPTDVRADRGMNGYCRIEASAEGEIDLVYLDWMGNPRHRRRFGQRRGEKAYRVIG